VLDHSERAGRGSDTLPGASALYLPLTGSEGSFGVVAVRPARPNDMFDPDQLHLLESLVNLLALAIERARLGEEAQRAHVQAETERMRNAILSSVSHDLRTPLATITGAASSLLERQDRLTPSGRQDLAGAIYEEANRLERLVRNLLDITRLEAGAVQLKKDWHTLDEIVGAALTRTEGRLRQQTINTTIPTDLPLLMVDGVLIEQAMINLLENAMKFAPPASLIELSAAVSDSLVIVEIADRGPGLPAGEEERIFDKFYRGGHTREGGVGLGLTISRGIIEAHGGTIRADNRKGGGALFRFSLPIERAQPEMELETMNSKPGA
jgi:two-component system, OmpR family, sensor histidine kinase KdpD